MEKKPATTSGEIDLLDLAARAREGIKKSGTIVRSYLNRLWRRKFLFLIIVLLITGAAYGLRFIIPPAYRTDAIFISYFLPARYHEMMINDLSRLMHDGDRTAVAEQLHLPTEIADQITEINVQPLPDPVFERSDTVRSPFKIKITLKKMSDLAAIQGGILFYLEGGEEGRKKREAQEVFLSEARAILLNRLKESADTKQTAIDTADHGRGKSEVDGILKVNEKLKEVQRVEVVRPFLKRSTYNYPDYTKYLVCGFILSILMAMLIVPFTVSINRSINK